MASMLEKLKGSSESATPHKIMETDHENIKLSRDQFEMKYRKKREIEAKLKLEEKRLIELAEKEQAELEKVGQEDNEKQAEE